VFEAHPESEFQVGGEHTRRGPYPSFQVLSHARLKATSDTLRGAGYYDRFTPARLDAEGPGLDAAQLGLLLDGAEVCETTQDRTRRARARISGRARARG
jgi:hypothetical protein